MIGSSGWRQMAGGHIRAGAGGELPARKSVVYLLFCFAPIK